jgi:hypothetical protein
MADFSDEAPLICYGDDGPCFVRQCPNCCRFLKFPTTIKWKESLDGLCEFQAIDCSKCGPVKPAHVGWTGDFR